MRKTITIAVGQKYGELTILSMPFKRGTRTLVKCRCSCGNECVKDKGNICFGHTRSCGHMRAVVSRQKAKTHDMSKTRTYGIWSGIITRCKNPKSASYPRYGAVGVRVCKRWERFDNFLFDMGVAPLNKSIDRIDNSKGYEPSNCRWSTLTEQANNKGGVHVITHNGESLTIRGWSEKTGLHPDLILGRINKGWPPTEAITIPKHPNRGRKLTQRERLVSAKERRRLRQHALRLSTEQFRNSQKFPIRPRQSPQSPEPATEES